MFAVLSLVAFALVYGAAMLGLRLQRSLPEAQRDKPTKQAVRLVMGLVATIAALVLSLLIASSYTYLATQQQEVQKLAHDVLVLDMMLSRYGPETKDMRKALRTDVVAAMQATSGDEGVGLVAVAAKGVGGQTSDLYNQVLTMLPRTNLQKFYQEKAMDAMSRIASTRLTMHEQATSSVPAGLMIVMVVWLMLLFLGFGLYAPANATVYVALGCGAFAAAGALFLILDMSHPYRGLIHVSDVPIRDSLQMLGR